MESQLRGKSKFVFVGRQNGNRVPAVFRDVMFVPKLQKHLISIGQLTLKKAEITFKEKTVELKFSRRSFKFGVPVGKLMS